MKAPVFHLFSPDSDMSQLGVATTFLINKGFNSQFFLFKFPYVMNLCKSLHCLFVVKVFLSILFHISIMCSYFCVIVLEVFILFDSHFSVSF